MRENLNRIETMLVIFIVILVLILIALGIIYSLNTLFHLGIPYTWKTLGAAGFLWGLFGNFDEEENNG